MTSNFWVQKSYSTAQTDAILYTASSGLRFVITDVIISTSPASTVTLQEDRTDDENIFKFTYAANGGSVINLNTPIKGRVSGSSLLFTSTGSGQVDVTISGYEE